MRQIMKKIVFGVVLLMLANAGKAQINFVKEKDKNIEQMLVEAKSAKKVLFIDMYTTWCGPCKWMDEHTFIDARVATKFNKLFVSYKVDGDTSEGANVRNLYKVGSYPTYVFVSPEGKVLHRIEGAMPPEMFMEEADFVVKLAKKQLP